VEQEVVEAGQQHHVDSNDFLSPEMAKKVRLDRVIE
jgi:hypothetical protein